MNDNDVLFQPLQLGAITAPHRIFMAPLTRGRATERVPNAMMAAIVFGQAFLANPDLPARLAADAPLNLPVPETFYEPSDRGYIDYPTFESQQP